MSLDDDATIAEQNAGSATGVMPGGQFDPFGIATNMFRLAAVFNPWLRPYIR